MLESLEKISLSFSPTHEMLNLISEIDEFKGKWSVLQNLSPERLSALRHVATIESVGSSTRIEGIKLTDREIETLLSNLKQYSFKSRNEEEVDGYAEAMELIFESRWETALTENHLKQLHSVLLKFSSKDTVHRGNYKQLSNNVVAFDADGKEIGIVFETASPFETPFETFMEAKPADSSRPGAYKLEFQENKFTGSIEPLINLNNEGRVRFTTTLLNSKEIN